MQAQIIDTYFNTLARSISETEVTDRHSGRLRLADSFGRVMNDAKAAHERGRKVMFVGNGGSAGIAAHMAIDFSKAGGIRAMAFNDSSALTCLGNDYGYDQVFSKQIEYHGRDGDILMAISSSGHSPNILSAAATARAIGGTVITFSGFSPDNPLRQSGDLNFYVKANEYGFVEVSHQALIHAMLDLYRGWTGQ
jgi:D-sedoheptulose 7-phosphate isomerase